MTTALAIPSQMRITLEERRTEIADALPEWVTADRFIITTLTAIGKNPALQQCTQASIYLSIIECARIGLYPDNKEAALVPFGKEAVLIPMVQGIIRLMLRSPGVLKVEARVVYEGDDFQFEYGLRPNLIHRPPIGGSNTEAYITHAYAIGWRQGTEPTFEVMTIDELELVRSFSKAANSPAYKNYVGEMYRKIVLKRLSKYFDLSPEANRAIALDHLVIGDPSIDGSLDGPSEEYQNLLVKNLTKAGLERLKVQIEGNGNQEDEPTKEVNNSKTEVVEDSPEIVNVDSEGLKKLKEERPKEIRPWPPEDVRDRVLGFVSEYKGTRKDEERPGGTLITFIAWQMNECFKGDPKPDGKRIAVLSYIFGPVESTNDLNGAQLKAVERWLGCGEHEGPDAGIFPCKEARLEAAAMFAAHLKEQGQQRMSV